MARPFTNPRPQFFSSTPEVLSGAQLFFYAAGTSTKLDTFSDEERTTANTNPVLLNASGYPATPIFLQDRAYKVILAPSTDGDPPTSPIWTFDDYKATDFDISPIWLTGSGTPSGNVAGTQGSAGVLPSVYWDFTNSILYICTTTGDEAEAVWTAVTAQSQASVPPPQGYLTPTSGTPVITGDVVSATAVYYTPDQGNLVPIYNGATFTPTAFTELTLTLHSSHATNTIYDVFVFSNAGVLTVVTGPAWSASTAGSGARGSGASTTELARVNGLYTNAVQITGRNGTETFTINANRATYLGSIFIDGVAGQVTCHRSGGQSRKWGVWNAYNRRRIQLQAYDNTASWQLTSSTVRASNNDSDNKITAFVGLAEEAIDCRFAQTADTHASQTTTIGIGENSTTVISGRQGRQLFANTSEVANLTAQYLKPPGLLGISAFQCLEASGNTNAADFFGGADDMLLIGEWRG